MIKPARILVVEDSPTQAECLRLVLESGGHEVDLAADAQQALGVLGPHDLVVSDIVMPVLSGYQLCRQIKDNPRWRHVPVILLTRLADPLDIIHVLECGADNFLAKPFEPEVLLERVRTILDHQALRRQGKLAPGAQIVVRGQRVAVATDKEQVVNLLMAAFEDALRTNQQLLITEAERLRMQEEITQAHAELERRVAQRTQELTEANARLQQEMSERQKLEERVRQSQKMEAIGQLAGGVAHDFNNLLTIISGYSDIMLKRLPPQDPGRGLIQEISSAGERAASLTRQLLAFSRKQVLAPRELNLNGVIADTEKLLRRLIGEDVLLATILAADLGMVKVDPGQIEQVIMNLALNSRDAMPRGGKLTIETRAVELDEHYAATHPEVTPGRHALLAVSDTGCGMTAEVQAHIFEPFFTTKGPNHGTGLGLATVFGIIKQSGGSIDVDSNPEHGTTVNIYLPIVERPAPAGKSLHGVKAPAAGNETLLLVEDDDAVRMLTRLSLESFGYSVLEACCGEEAIQVSDGHAGLIHLLVTDVVMPGLGGRQVAERLQALRPGLKVLYLSGYMDDAVVRHGVLLAETAFLQKPFTPTALMYKVREVLDA